MAVVTQPTSGGDFKYGLFDCCGNIGDCLCAWCFPHCYAFVASQDAGEGCISSFIQCWCYPLCLCCLRQNARNRRGIDGSCCGDLCVTWCCPCCAVIQIRREFKE